MSKERIRLILRRSIQVWLLCVVLLSNPLAFARNFCSSVFSGHESVMPEIIPQGKALTTEQAHLLKEKGLEPSRYTYLGGGSEGHVFLDRTTQQVVKSFKRAVYFDNLMWLETNVTPAMLAAGYKVGATLKADSANLLVQRKLYTGMTLQEFGNRYLHKDPDLWQTVFNQYRKIFRKLRKDLRARADFIDESRLGERGYFDTLEGTFQGSSSFYLLLHDGNILVNEVAPGKFEFTVIDFH